MKQAILQFEPDMNGLIFQSYLMHDMQNSLDQVSQITIGLSDAVNVTTARVSDIVSLQHLNPDPVLETVHDGKNQLNEINLELEALDHTQTSNLSEQAHHLETMNKYINDLLGKFESGKIQIAHYDPVVLQSIPEYSQLTEYLAEKDEELSETGTLSVEIDLKATFDEPGEIYDLGADAVEFYDLYKKVRKGFKIERIVNKNGTIIYRVYRTELVGGRPTTPAKPYKEYYAGKVKEYARKGWNTNVNRYLHPGVAARTALRSTAAWVGVGIDTVGNIYENVKKGEDTTRIVTDTLVDVGIGAVSLAVGGAVATVAVALGAPLLGGAAVVAIISTGVTIILESVTINGKSLEDHLKDSVNKVSKSAVKAVKTIAGWFDF